MAKIQSKSPKTHLLVVFFKSWNVSTDFLAKLSLLQGDCQHSGSLLLTFLYPWQPLCLTIWRHLWSARMEKGGNQRAGLRAEFHLGRKVEGQGLPISHPVPKVVRWRPWHLGRGIHMPLHPHQWLRILNTRDCWILQKRWQESGWFEHCWTKKVWNPCWSLCKVPLLWRKQAWRMKRVSIANF